MKKYRFIFMGLSISAVIFCMLSSCGLEKRVIVTTRGHEATLWNSHKYNNDILQTDCNLPRDTVINYQIK